MEYIETTKQKNILIGISGSIAVSGIFPYLGVIRSNFKAVKVIMTESANQLIPATTIKHYCDDVYVTESPTTEKTMGHINLSKWADVFIILPATANTIAAAAHGIANNLLSTTILAYHHPVIFFPNMNSLMWEKNAVQRNIDILQEDDHIIFKPVKTMAFEIATGSLKPNYVLPSYKKVMDFLSNFIRENQ